MTEKRPTPDESAGKAARRKRVAPTIDLTATEVSHSDVAKADVAAEVPASDVPLHEATPTSEADPPLPPEPNVSEVPIDVPPPEFVSNEPADAAPDVERAAPAEELPPPPIQESRKSARSSLTLPVLAAGFVGAAIMSAILLTMWLTGLLPIRFAGLTATRARVAALEMQIQDLQKRPAAAAASTDTKAVDALNQRIAKVEDSLTKIPSGDPALAERVTSLTAATALARERAEAAEKAVADLRSSVQDVSKTANAGASSADLAPLQQRIAALEQAAKTASTEIAKATASDASARLALSAASLRDAALRGAPFSDELAQAKALGADDKTLAPLSAYAASGVPSEKALAAELSALLPGMIKANGAAAPSGGFIERLQANAAQLVRVRPVDAPVGDDPSTVLARLEVDAVKADIAAALSDLAKLSDAQRAPAQAWIAKAQGRQAALNAARQFAADSARSLGSK